MSSDVRVAVGLPKGEVIIAVYNLKVPGLALL
jgi:hypothetical protein